MMEVAVCHEEDVGRAIAAPFLVTAKTPNSLDEGLRTVAANAERWVPVRDGYGEAKLPERLRAANAGRWAPVQKLRCPRVRAGR